MEIKRRKNIAILLAAGKSERMKMNIYKQFIKINNRFLYEFSIRNFIDVELIDEIVLVINKEHYEKVKEFINIKYKSVHLCVGGSDRAESLNNGINYVKSLFYKEFDNINIISHDVARPFVSRKIIEENVKALDVNDVVNTVYPSSDSLAMIEERKTIGYPNRSLYYQVQTPQSFRLDKYIIANFRKIEKHHEINDVIKMFYLNDFDIYNTYGEKINFKITDQTDLTIAKAIVKSEI